MQVGRTCRVSELAGPSTVNNSGKTGRSDVLFGRFICFTVSLPLHPSW